MKRIISLVCVIMLLCMHLCISVADAQEFTNDMDDTLILEKTVISEYELLLEQMHKNGMKTNSRAADKENSLNEYKQELTRRASLPETELKGYGYTDEQIALLKAYDEGKKTFEEIAPYAAATLSTTLAATKHTTKAYTLRYTWSWSAVPTYAATDKVVLATYAFKSNGDQANLKVNSSAATVYYKYYSGKQAQTDNITTTLRDDFAVEAAIPMLQKDANQQENIWAQGGQITCNITPLGSASSFDGVRAKGSYGHAGRSQKLSVTVKLNPVTGTISITFKASSSVTVTGMGTKQSVFYTDGKTTVEV